MDRNRVNSCLNRIFQILKLRQLVDAQTRSVSCQVRGKMLSAEDGREKLVESTLTAKDAAPADTWGATCGSWNKPTQSTWVHAFRIIPVIFTCGPNMWSLHGINKHQTNRGQIYTIHSELFTSLLPVLDAASSFLHVFPTVSVLPRLIFSPRIWTHLIEIYVKLNNGLPRHPLKIS